MTLWKVVGGLFFNRPQGAIEPPTRYTLRPPSTPWLIRAFYICVYVMWMGSTALLLIITGITHLVGDGESDADRIRMALVYPGYVGVLLNLGAAFASQHILRRRHVEERESRPARNEESGASPTTYFYLMPALYTMISLALTVLCLSADAIYSAVS